MKKLGILCLIVGASAAVWMPYSVFSGITEGLLVFLGLLVAALVQIIPVTTNFLQADSLTPNEARKLAGVLETQQRYWLGLLAAAVMCCVFLIIAKAIGGFNFAPTLRITEHLIPLEVNRLLSGAIAAMLALLFSRMIGFFPGIMSLQKLRGQLVLNAANRRQAQIEKEALVELAKQPPPADLVPADYGRVIHPPKH